MIVNKISISNYKSVAQEQHIYLSRGFNIIIGENNSGKSSVLDCIPPLSFPDVPHTSLLTKPYTNFALTTKSWAKTEIEISTEDLFLYFGRHAFMSMPPNLSEPSAGLANQLQQPIQRFAVEIDYNTLPTVRLHFHSNGAFASGVIGGGVWYGIVLSQTTTGHSMSPAQSTEKYQQIISEQLQHLSTFMYRFNAERMNIERSVNVHSPTLQSNASNLASCINWIQGSKPSIHKSLRDYVHQIFPSVFDVRSTPVFGDASQSEIRVWISPTPENSGDRPDLSQPLSKMGTGLGQVLAILYVALTAEHSTVIAIDEPSSFLHPRATRSLFKILEELPIKHQYIITTHSPEVIRAIEPSTLTLLTNKGGITVAESLAPEIVQDVQRGLSSIGTKLSDVYASSNILWVEGETEESCIPEIAKKLLHARRTDIDIIRVRATGDFESKKGVPKFVFDVYSRLTSSGSLLPKHIAYIFDREDRPQNKIDDLVKESGGKIMFLPRMTFENYLLHPDGIAASLKNLGENIEPAQISEWIEKNGNKFCKGIAPPEGGYLANDEWVRSCNAPKLLADLFQDLTNARQIYRKTRDSVFLNSWLIQNAPKTLDELVDFLKPLFEEEED